MREPSRNSQPQSIAIARHAGSLHDLEREWAPLVDEAHPAAPFRTFAWISSWWSCASTSSEAEVLTARRGGELVGLLPLYVERAPLGGRRLRLMGDGIVGSDGLGAIARAQDLVEVSLAFAEHLRRARADELQLDDLAVSDPLAHALVAIDPEGVEHEPRFQCPYIRVAGDFADYVARLPDGIGKQLDRRERWLRKAGARFELCTSPPEIERGLDVLFELHRRRWALDGGSEAIDRPEIEAFHREAGRKLALLGWARLWLLHVDGAPRAALYGFRHANRLAFYQAGHDPDWRPRAVGSVLLGHVIRGCFEERLSEFDFLRGDEAYKLKWATAIRETLRVRARASGVRPLLAHGARRGWTLLKSVARTHAPGAFTTLRALKREVSKQMSKRRSA